MPYQRSKWAILCKERETPSHKDDSFLEGNSPFFPRYCLFRCGSVVRALMRSNISIALRAAFIGAASEQHCGSEAGENDASGNARMRDAARVQARAGDETGMVAANTAVA